MSQPKLVIIDTDPGVDDVLAILLALAASPQDNLRILLISVTFGNVDVRSCLRNVVSIFHIVDRELQWRKAQQLDPGFETLRDHPPVKVAVGAEGPVGSKNGEGESDMRESADYFHGRDGLAGTHTSHPHFSPEEAWEKLFEEPTQPQAGEDVISKTASATGDASGGLKPQESVKRRFFEPCFKPAHTEMLDLLREYPEDSISIISIGPLTNLALAAAEDPYTFLKAKEVISMGGAVKQVGNVTPCAEFNVFADPVAAARVYALTSPTPSSTMPVQKSNKMWSTNPYAKARLPYPRSLPRQLNLTLMALDITELHVLTSAQFQTATTDLVKSGSPLACWLNAFLPPMFAKSASMDGTGLQLAMHDPMCIWYVLTSDSSSRTSWIGEKEDIRVETTGQWTKGMTLRDERPGRSNPDTKDAGGGIPTQSSSGVKTIKRRDSDGEAPHDRGNWWGRNSGNQVRRMTASPGVTGCAEALMGSLFGQGQRG